jgi:hypothetical protein
MNHYLLLHPRNYISAADLDGKDITVTIKSIAKEELIMEGGRKDVVPIITFEKATKRFCCNKTNAKSIAQQHGPDVDQWVGKQITLFPTTTKAKGETVDCLRIRPGKAFTRAAIAS